MRPNSDKVYLQQLIAEGEHQQQDFKFEISDARKIARASAGRNRKVFSLCADCRREYIGNTCAFGCVATEKQHLGNSCEIYRTRTIVT